MEQVNLETLNQNVLNLMRIVESIKEDIEDRFLTADEEIKLEKARKEIKEGTCKSIEDLEKKFNVSD